MQHVGTGGAADCECSGVVGRVQVSSGCGPLDTNRDEGFPNEGPGQENGRKSLNDQHSAG